MSRAMTLVFRGQRALLWLFALFVMMQSGCLADCGGEINTSKSVCEQCPDRCIQTKDGKERCVACINDKQCRTISGSTKICSKDNRCICGTNTDCPAGQQCSGTRGCLECTGDSHCTSPDRPFCGDNNRCVRCKVGSVQACAPAGDSSVCNKGTQTCRVGGVWGDCKDWLKCKEGQSCKEGQCIQNCPAASCQLGQKSCVSNPDDPGEFVTCVRNEKGCLEFSSKTQACPGTQVCRNGQCLPRTCGSNACKIGTQECTDSSNIRLCVKDPQTGCPVWEASKACPSGKQCSSTLDRCVVCLPGTKQPCYRGPSGTKDVGLCRSGAQVCVTDGSKWAACVGDTLPTKEACNGKDDDCNGQADEGCKCKNGDSRACGSSVGACKKGTQTCQSGTWGKCLGQTLPKAEICNGKDDNCDGKIDETFSTKGQACSKGQSECKATGKWVCTSDGTSVECDAQPKSPSKEICDGKDNDCNGKIDDNLQAPDCTKQDGVCKGAKQKCTGQGGWLDCGSAEYVAHNAAYETKETNCDGKDNDCDGKTDSNLSRSCYTGPAGTASKGLCKEGTQTCSSGAWGTCTGETKPTAEICDGKDNNCDGSVDEGIAPKSCYTGPAGTAGKGRCKAGLQVCQNGKFAACSGEVLPLKTETCNNVDDDCDGAVDEKLTRPCFSGPGSAKGKGLCKDGTQTCAAGKWGTCAGEILPKTEICDGKDNDCDGAVDENVTRACYTGPSGTLNKGICKGGTETCAAGKWGACTGETKPASKEICNGKDNNCNGQVGEGCQCQDGSKRVCGSSTGECKEGQQTCTSGAWGACAGEVKATVEKCDGKDNDCDGKVDEDFTSKGQACNAGRGECRAAGKYICKTDGSGVECDAKPGTPKTEVCDNKDNDCDGLIDDSLTRPCYSGPSGTSGVGICSAGQERCVAGKWGACTGETKPKTEVCDGKDNDCDGKVDEGLTRACYTGKAGTKDVGLCKGGTQSCTSGRWSTCVGQIIPIKEKCNKKDDDCDGAIDEGDTCAVMYHLYGPDNQRARGIAIDSKNNFYVVGFYAKEINFGTVAKQTSRGSNDGFIAKFDPKGQYVWSVQIGGTLSDTIQGIEKGSRGHFYIYGTFQGTVKFGARTLTSSGGNDVFVSKMDASGKFVWTSHIKSAQSVAVAALELDSKNNVLVFGHYTTTATFGPTNLTSKGGANLYVSKISTNNGAFQWSQSYGDGASTTSGRNGLAVNKSSGDIYITGRFSGTTNIGGKKMTSHTRGRMVDGFFGKLNKSGAVQWLRHIDSFFDDGGAQGAEVDSQGNLYVGAKISSRFTIAGKLFTGGGFDDGFLFKVDPNGTVLWSKHYDTIRTSGVLCMAFTKNNDVYVGGFFYHSLNIGGKNIRGEFKEDALVTGFKTDGTLLSVRSAGSWEVDKVFDIAIAPNGKIYAVGDFGRGFASRAVKFGPRSFVNKGGADGFVWEITPP